MYFCQHCGNIPTLNRSTSFTIQ